MLVLSMREYCTRVSGLPVICIEEALTEHPVANGAISKVRRPVSPDDTVYVIYTSGMILYFWTRSSLTRFVLGTTGKPKGVNVKHSNVTNRMSTLISSALTLISLLQLYVSRLGMFRCALDTV